MIVKNFTNIDNSNNPLSHHINEHTKTTTSGVEIQALSWYRHKYVADLNINWKVVIGIRIKTKVCRY